MIYYSYPNFTPPNDRDSRRGTIPVQSRNTARAPISALCYQSRHQRVNCQAEDLLHRERPEGQAAEVRRTGVAGGVPADGLTQRLAVALDLAREVRHEPLGDQRRLDELDGKAGLQVPLDVAVEKPCPWVVRDESGGR